MIQFNRLGSCFFNTQNRPLSCTAAKKQSWEKEYNNFTTSHEKRYKNDKLAAQQAVADKLKKQKERKF